MSRTNTLPVLALAGLIALTGCSTPEPTFDPDSVAEVPADAPADAEPQDEPEPELIDACAALTGLDVAALMGEEMDEPEPGSSACRLNATSAMSAATLYIQANAEGERTYANQKSLLTVTEELTSPGDEAFLGDTALAKGLDVLAGGHHLSVRIHRQSSPITSGELVSVAETVLTNLGW